MPQKAVGDSQPLWAHMCKGACGPLEFNLTNSGCSSKDVSSIMPCAPGFVAPPVDEREREGREAVGIILDDGWSIAQSIVENVAEFPACIQLLK